MDLVHIWHDCRYWYAVLHSATLPLNNFVYLFQACIDDNLDMVEFLVENDSDVDVCDNEGWTPLHATASCGFTEIAR